MEENRKDQWSQDDSHGQQQYYGNQQKEGDYDRDVNDTSTSLEEKEDEEDVEDVDIHAEEGKEKLEQDEVDMPERERSTTAPYAGNSSEQSHGYNPNASTDKNDNSVDKQNGCC